MGRQETPQWRGGISGGIWQPVCITATGLVRLSDIFIETDIRKNTAAFKLDFESNSINTMQADVSMELSSSEGKVVVQKEAKLILSPGHNTERWVVNIPDAQFWTLENPYLYKAKFIVKQNAEISDVWEHKFGLREFTVRGKKFYLNDKPIYLKATFYLGISTYI